MVEPVWHRTAAVVTLTGSSVVARLQPAFDRTAAVSQEAAGIAAAFLTPLAAVSLVFGLWRLAADLGWTGTFIVASGLFSHWQVWIALAIALTTLASHFSQPSRDPDKENRN
jgi:H+/Cl- antiporter ClcA